jgi:hypothetical protein
MVYNSIVIWISDFELMDDPQDFKGLYHFRQLEEALAAAQMFEDLGIHVLKDEGPFTLW